MIQHNYDLNADQVIEYIRFGLFFYPYEHTNSNLMKLLFVDFFFFSIIFERIFLRVWHRVGADEQTYTYQLTFTSSLSSALLLITVTPQPALVDRFSTDDPSPGDSQRKQNQQQQQQQQ